MGRLGLLFLNCMVSLVAILPEKFAKIVSTALFWIWDPAAVARAVSTSSSFKSRSSFVKIWCQGRPTLVVKSSELAIKIMNKPNYSTRFGDPYGLYKIGMLDKGIIWNYDHEKWKSQRKLFQSALNQRQLGRGFDLTIQAYKFMLDEMDLKKDFEARWFLSSITMNVTLKLMFGLEFRRDDVLLELVKTYFEAWQYFLLMPEWLSKLLFWKTMRHSANTRAFVEKAKQIVREFEELRNPPSCFLQNLIQGRKDGKWTAAEVEQCVMEMLLAGTDTSSITMLYTLVGLSSTPEAEATIYRELLQNKQDLLMKEVYESMRVHPVGPIIMRRALEDDEELKIVKDTQIVIYLPACHSDEHWPDPVPFCPARFRAGEKNPHFTPFGVGDKSCVGQFLAEKEMSALLSSLMKRFRFQSQTKMNAVEKRWDVANLPTKPIRAFLVPRRHVYFVGPSSTGKSTLIKKLTATLETDVFKNYVVVGKLAEVGRRYFEERKIQGDDMKTNPLLAVEAQEEIWKRQCDEEEKLIGELALVDRSSLDTFYYAKKYGRVSYEEFERRLDGERLKKTLERCRCSEQSLFVLVKPVDANATYKKDGTRALDDDPSKWMAEGEEYERLLNQYNIQYVVIDMLDLEERVNVVMSQLFQH
eukprot:TRINITY_DN236_c0_g1_i2.p1 TRINITY_DN236_c0_g1~~TRINITY_DN236_c0_g1_i2.p1  ORF type:complete len:642 (+),score=118.29 TRINITY_DN236_c0_g1_i2:94-2019(+)